MIKYSILIPNYGYNPFLEDCIVSAEKQTHNKGFEVEIIFCDQSDEKTHQIIKNKIHKLVGEKLIKVIRLEEPSILNARKKLIEIATGDYIVFLDSDDFVSDSYLLNIHSFLGEKCYPDLVIDNFCMVNSNKKKLKYQLPVPNDISENVLNYFYYSNYLNSIVRKIFKRELFNSDNIPQIDIKNGDDWLISLPIMGNAKSIFFVDNFFGYFYRQNPESSTHLFDYKVAVSALYFKDRLIDLNMNQYQRELYLHQKMYDFINCFRSLLKNNVLNKRAFKKELIVFRNNIFNDLHLCHSSGMLSKKQKIIFALLKSKSYFIIYLIFRL